NDERIVTLLGDIGVFGFKKIFEQHKERIYNLGILEQSTIGIAAGIAHSGMIPTVHTIATFLVERAIEQLKIDFCYQQLGGNFISVGASYDYAALGATHHCPEDVALLLQLPSMEIIVPGTPKEFDLLFRQSYSNEHSTYFRLSEEKNSKSYDVVFGKAEVLKKGNTGTIIVVGTMADSVVAASEELDVTILYYTTISPFDSETLRNNLSGQTITICEPFFEGTMTSLVANALPKKPFRIETIGVPKAFVPHYGTKLEIDEEFRLTPLHIKKRLQQIYHE
ncbi:MAG: hypothetical protein FD122_3727, partial [Stygiobacter sp.]